MIPNLYFMTTQKQIEANKENAMKGGVKTPEGKAVSKWNAMKHGLLSKEILLPEENENELIELGKRFRLELAPEGEIELLLVERIIGNSWRLKRAMQIEREMMEGDMSGVFKSNTLGRALSIDFANNDTYSKFVRYETSIERGIYKALHELQRIQAARRGEPTPLPVAVDVDVSVNENGFVS